MSLACLNLNFELHTSSPTNMVWCLVLEGADEAIVVVQRLEWWMDFRTCAHMNNISSV